MPESSPSVLIIRLDAIGDALALTPLLAAFAQRGIPVDVALRPINASIFSSRAARRTIAADFDLRSGTAANRSAIAALGRDLGATHYSHALVATEDPGGYRLARASGAPVRVGFTNGWGKPFKALWARTQLTRTVFRPAGLDPQAPHECEVLFALGASLLGDSARPTRDASVLRPLVVEREPPRDARVAVQFTDKWERLGIAFDGVAAAIGRIAAIAPLRAIASSSERAYAQRLATATGLAVEYFGELGPWKEAIAAARAIVAPDSGALHVAGMTGTPVVAVFPFSPGFALQAGRWSPWAAPHRIVCATGDWPQEVAAALSVMLAG